MPPQPGPVSPLLPPLYGSLAYQAEVRSVVAELITHLQPNVAQRVQGIPVSFESDPNDVNAFAGCDDSGTPFMATTEGFLSAVDAMAQTRATDEVFGTQTYEAYMAYVVPRLINDKGSPALPPGIIAPQHWPDMRRFSRAHQLADEIIAFTLGHELAHHYLGHTGCANGQAMGGGPSPATLGNLFARVIPAFNQPNELGADNAGVMNVLATGRARQATSYRWTERGGIMLLDFFGRLERAAGSSPLSPMTFLRTHPNPAFRIPLVQATAQAWRSQNPG
ncbi:MAG: hypothetical protein WCI05_07325 [Myxococcales bacterium]